MSAAASIEQQKIVPLVRTEFGLAEHNYRRFNAVVPAGTTKDELEDPAFWVHVQNDVRVHDEIRAVAEDSSFVALMLVCQKAGGRVYPRVVWGTEIGEIQTAASGQARYVVKMRGRLQWCVVDTETGANIKERIPKRSLAERELEELIAALNR